MIANHLPLHLSSCVGRAREVNTVKRLLSAGRLVTLVGSYQQSVPVYSANRTTTFSFSYTFTNDDAAVGKVTFQAVATIMGARDALPADNTAMASPTKVS